MQKIYLKIIVATFAMAVSILPLAAQNYTVNSNGDTHAANAASSALDAGGMITLRSAMEASTQIAGSHIITIPQAVGTINLTLGQITTGNAALGNNITVNGPGKALLTINQTTQARIFFTGLGAVTFSLNGVTLNYTGPVATGILSGGGGAILAGGVGAITSLNDVAITNFQIQVGNGGALSVSTNAIHSLTVTNCTFTNNKCGGGGGAITYSGLGTASITNSTFTNNQTGPLGANTGGAGGAISTSGTGNGGTYTISNCSFVTNKVLAATAQGGAIINTNGALTVNFNRFTGNTAPDGTNGNTIAQTGGSTINTINSNNNWWGQNAPTANDNVVLAAGGTITTTKWLQLKLTPAASSVCSNSTTLVTASFLSNSASEAVTTGNISTLIGLPISFVSPVLGTLSGAQATIQASGTATVSYTGGAAAGAGSVNGVVDNLTNSDATAKAAITITASPAITLNPSAGTSCLGLPVSFTATPSNQTSVVWQESANAGFATPTTLTNTGIYSGATSNTLTISDNTTVNGKYYRLVASNSNGCGPANSTGALVTATNPTLASNNTITQAVGVNNNLYYAPSCGIIAKVVASGATPVSGNVTSQVWVEGTVPNVSGQPYVQRHYQVTPATGAATATGTVTLYFSQAEFNNFNADPGSTLDLPTGPADAVGIANLRVAKYTGTSSNGTGLPGTYSPGTIVIDPVDANIVWNATNSRWEVTISVTGFSGFIVQTSTVVLPVKLVSFNARLNNNNTLLQWVIAQAEDGIRYDLQRSPNGTGFTTVHILQGDAGTTSFTYTDPLPSAGKFYYRLQVTDRTGKITYSNILFVKTGNSGQEITIYPNPVKKGQSIQLNLQNARASGAEMTNNSGQVVYSSTALLTGSTSIELPSGLAPGVYVMKIFTTENIVVKKIVIQ